MEDVKKNDVMEQPQSAANGSLIEPVNDSLEVSEEDKKHAEELQRMEEFLDEYNCKPVTDILESADKRFKSKEDKRIFHMLPLSDRDKENMLLALYGIDVEAAKALKALQGI